MQRSDSRRRLWRSPKWQSWYWKASHVYIFVTYSSRQPVLTPRFFLHYHWQRLDLWPYFFIFCSVHYRMHSIYSRVNGVSALWSTCIMVLLAAVALSSFLFNADPKGNLDIVSLKVWVPHSLAAIESCLRSHVKDLRWQSLGSTPKRGVIHSETKKLVLWNLIFLLVRILSLRWQRKSLTGDPPFSVPPSRSLLRDLALRSLHRLDTTF